MIWRMRRDSVLPATVFASIHACGRDQALTHVVQTPIVLRQAANRQWFFLLYSSDLSFHSNLTHAGLTIAVGVEDANPPRSYAQ